MGLESEVLEPSYSFSEIGGTDAEITNSKNQRSQKCRPLELPASGAVGL